ncbi:unnamed protein product [Closterium sp. NIES-53]
MGTLHYCRSRPRVRKQIITPHPTYLQSTHTDQATRGPLPQNHSPTTKFVRFTANNTFAFLRLPCPRCPTRSALPVALPACSLARYPHAALLALPARALPEAHAHPVRTLSALPTRCLRAADAARAMRFLPAHCLPCSRTARTPLAPPERCPYGPPCSHSDRTARTRP